MLYDYKYKWEKIQYAKVIICYLSLNITLVLVHLHAAPLIKQIIWHFSFSYSSPILLINSILAFILFGKLKFNSKLINSLAKSSLAIYLIHGSRPYFIGAIGNATFFLNDVITNKPLFFLSILGLTLLVITIAIIIDNILTPVWNLINKLGNVVYNKLGY